MTWPCWLTLGMTLRVLESHISTMPSLLGTAGNFRKLQLETLVTDLEYADDMALLADSWDDLEAMLTSLSTHCRNLGLSINCAKTKTMAVLPSDTCTPPAPIHLFPDQPTIEPVSSFHYLGSIVQDDCGSDLEVNSQICKASQVFGSLSRILWYQKKIRSQTKLRIFSSVILPTLLYGTECVVLLEPQIHRLQSFIMRCLCIILGISVWDMKRNTVIRKLASPLCSLHVASASLVTSPGCLTPGFPSNCWSVLLLEEPDLWGGRNVAGMTWHSETW